MNKAQRVIKEVAAKGKTSEPLIFDFKDSPGTVSDDIKSALETFGLYVYDLPALDGSDNYGFVISDHKMTKKDLIAYETEWNLRNEE